MKFGICNETFGDWPLEKALAFAREAGYTGWEIAPFMLTENLMTYSTTKRREYRKAVEGAGFEIIGLHWLLAKTKGLHLTTQDRVAREDTSEYLRELIRLCSDLGGEVMVLGSPLQRNYPKSQSLESAMRNAASVIRDVTPDLEEYCVRIAVEPLGRQEGNFLNTAASARKLISMIDSEHVRLHLDVKAMSDEETPIVDIIRDNADAMIHFHANDANRQGPGMGEIDFKPIFQTLKEVGYDGWVSVEVFDYEPGVERLVTESMANMRAAMD
ncbi:D-tagatose 3-epimerase [Rubripirellula amarantea]|uniref:D-tagatose 3-epimerase n=1 Tax=Rubripirellula amarantea TaxID=2527999 RepID=A0A5C5WJ88_9BACT|nr:sugar phosphate isomerase/epimerase family protein [Rubripirellula amarantea]TWT50710.1 D-tagatose 3-epimerase [Rubripirellula amarantea]